MENTKNELEIAWAAGFFEGEGSMRCIPKKNRKKDGTYCEKVFKQLHIRANQVSPEPLNRLRLQFGGNVHGPHHFKSMKKNHQPMYYWDVRGGRAEDVLLILFPHLSDRHQIRISETLYDYYNRPKNIKRPQRTALRKSHDGKQEE